MVNLQKKVVMKRERGGEREGRELKRHGWGAEGGCTFYERVNSEIQSSPKCSNVSNFYFFFLNYACVRTQVDENPFHSKTFYFISSWGINIFRFTPLLQLLSILLHCYPFYSIFSFYSITFKYLYL